MTKTARASKPKGSYDWALLSVVTILLMLGVVMVFSASYPRGMEGFDNPYYFVIRQLIWLAIGISGLIVPHASPIPSGTGGAFHSWAWRCWRCWRSSCLAPSALAPRTFLLSTAASSRASRLNRHHHLRQRLAHEQRPPHSRCARRTAALWRADGGRGGVDRPAAGNQHGNSDCGDRRGHALCRARWA
ncbi:MAG: FtsW/RodA/SpoVE family cell cycle protein [Anaerolineales bacterium]|nr:FtsW/RodA/SpoVE family cell cycle protein [Anaerolineales bacterium]